MNIIINQHEKEYLHISKKDIEMLIISIIVIGGYFLIGYAIYYAGFENALSYQAEQKLSSSHTSIDITYSNCTPKYLMALKQNNNAFNVIVYPNKTSNGTDVLDMKMNDDIYCMNKFIINDKTLTDTAYEAWSKV